jgi:chemotaxis protein histidine kinase CheA
MESSTIQEQIYELRRQYVAKLGHKIDLLQQQWSGILACSGNLESQPDFQRLLHNLRGSAGVYGCVELGEIAGEIEKLLVQQISEDGQLTVNIQ